MHKRAKELQDGFGSNQFKDDPEKSQEETWHKKLHPGAD